MLSKRLANISISKTSSTRNKADELKKQGLSISNLSAGELSVDTLPEIQNAALMAIRGGKNCYTEAVGIGELREAIANSASKRIGLSYSKNNVAVTNGAKQALFNAVFALFNPGDKVIVPLPCWGTFVAQLTMLGIEPILLDTTEDDYQLTEESLERVIDKDIKGLILNSPNNPTGVIYTNENLVRISKVVKKYNLWLIFDECYNEIYFSGNKCHNILSLNPEIKDKTVVINSFSKTYAITGWRIGYMLGSQELINSVKIIQSHSTSNPNVIAQYAVLPVLKDYNDYSQLFINKIRSEIYNNYLDAIKILNSIPNISYINPQGAFYFFVNFKWYLENNDVNISSIDELCEYLLTFGYVAVVSGSAFYSNDCIRISISGPSYEVLEGLNKLKQVIIQLPIKEFVGIS